MNNPYAENNFNPIGFNSIKETGFPVQGIGHSSPVIWQLNYGFPLNNKYKRLFKRAFDIITCIILIPVILSWLVPLMAIIIKLGSRGPVFFLQKRNGDGGRLFTCIKFRTMVVNEEADLLAARHDDIRVTAVGKFLRHYHIDELPQLFNVLIGDMSVIGPRPYMVNENLYYENLLEQYALRHTVKPGITGLAQSYGYFGSLQDLDNVKERVALDVTYVRSWTISMDIKILARTFMAIFGFEPEEEAAKLPERNKKIYNLEKY